MRINECLIHPRGDKYASFKIKTFRGSRALATRLGSHRAHAARFPVQDACSKYRATVNRLPVVNESPASTSSFWIPDRGHFVTVYPEISLDDQISLG